MAKFKIELQLKSTEEESPRILLTDFDSNNESNNGITFEETLTEEENDLYTLDFQVPHMLENGLQVGSLIKVGRVLWLTLQDNRVIKMIITNFSIDEGDENWVYSVSAKDYASYIFAKTSVGLELDTFTDEDFWDWMGQKGFDFTTVEDIGNYILNRSFLRNSHGLGWKVIDNGTFKAWNLDDYQIVANSGFSNGTTGWTSFGGTSVALNGNLTNTSNGLYSNSAIFQDVLPLGDLVYGYSRVKVNGLAVSSLTTRMNGGASASTILNNPVSGVSYFSSFIGVCTSQRYEIIHSYSSAGASGGQTIEVDFAGAFNVSQMIRDGARYDNGDLFNELDKEKIKAQLDLWISKDILLNDDLLPVNTDERERIVGKNLFDVSKSKTYSSTFIYENIFNGSLSNTKHMYSEDIIVNGFSNITFSFTIDKIHRIVLLPYDVNGNLITNNIFDVNKVSTNPTYYIKHLEPINKSPGNRVLSLTIPSSVYKIKIGVINFDTTVASITNIQLEEGSVATSYKPYTDSDLYLPSANMKRARIEAGNDILEHYQLIENGDLTIPSADLNIPQGFTYNAATNISLTNGIAKFTATAQYGHFRQTSPNVFNIVSGDIYYFYTKVKMNSSCVMLIGGVGHDTGVISNNNWTYTSKIFTASSNYSGAFIRINDTRLSGWTPIEVDYMGAFNISQMQLNGVKADNGTLFSKMSNADIKTQLDIWVQNNKKIIASVYNISVSNSNLYNALVELANISNRAFKINYVQEKITFYEKDDEQVYDKNYQLVDKLNIQDSSLSYNGEELYGLFYVLGAKDLEDSYVFLQDETEYKDSFIYDFSYFKDAGFLSEDDIKDINGIFGIGGYDKPDSWGELRTLKAINEELQNIVGTLDTLESNLSLMEGRIKNHIVNALGDGEITPEEFAQVDAFFEYSAQEEEFKTEIKNTLFRSYDWSKEPEDVGEETDSDYTKWTVPNLAGASFKYANEVKNTGRAPVSSATLTFKYGRGTYKIAFSTTQEAGYESIYYDGTEKNKPPKLYYNVIEQSGTIPFQRMLLQVVSTRMRKEYKIVEPIFKRKMPYFELLYQIGGDELISKKLEEINKEIEEYEELWIEDEKELELESAKLENKDENKIAMLTERIKGYRLIIGEYTYNRESKTLTPIKEQPGWKTTLKRIYGDFLEKWETTEFDDFRENTLVLRVEKRKLLQEKQNFWYTLKEKYGRSTFAEGYYENELELNSKDLMNQAKAIYESHKKPTEDFSITYIDISDIIGLNIDQIKVGDFIKIKKDKYNIQTNSYSKIKVSSISRTLREDANIQLTINRVNLLDKLLEKIIVESQK